MKKQRVIFILFSVALLLCCFVILSLPKGAFAFTLPDTGQTKCYNTADAEISCTGTGQDGAYNINPMSYTDNGNGTITDNVTGLMWQKGENSTYYNWYVASGTYDATYNPSSQNVCGSLNLAGYTDWRLPTKKELLSIVDYSIPFPPGPTINTTYFPNTYKGDYWSSTPYASSTGNASIVDFYGGFVSYNSKPDSYYVRCVRALALTVGGGQSAPSFSYTNNGNGTITDSSTNLMWQQAKSGRLTWSNALTYCKGLSLGRQTDWRLPNIKELESITDDTKYNPAIDTIYFQNTYANNYWSSTAGAYSTDYAWGVDFADGNFSLSNTSHNYYVRCVRGQSGHPVI